jgi:hypothetical protein
MDIATTIAATYESFKGAKDIINSVLNLKVDSEVRIEINKAQHQLGDALASLFELREKLFELQQENHGLRGEVLSQKALINKLTNGDPCPKCHTGRWSIESSGGHPMPGDMGAIQRVYKCDDCGYTENKILGSGVSRR